MNVSAQAVVVRAPFVAASADEVHENGAVLIVGTQVQSVGPHAAVARAAPAGCRTLDAADCFVVPGLVNAHTHLDLTGLGDTDLGLAEGAPFVDWIRTVTDRRNHWTPEQHVASYRRGLALALAGGATTVGDVEIPTICDLINQAGEDDPRPRRVRYVELLSPLDEQAPAVLEAGLARAMTIRNRDARPADVPALSPHAPYSVSAPLFSSAAAAAATHNVPLAIHVSETPEELTYVRDGAGPWRDFLDSLGLSVRHVAHGLTPVEYLQRLGVLRVRPTLIHANCLADGDIDIIARTRCPVVYCPGTHHYFRRGTHPLRALLDAGIPVALGTDSLASNESLSLLDEIRRLLKQHPEISPREALRMASAHGRHAVGGNPADGDLRPGGPADLVALRSLGAMRNGWDALGDPSTRVSFVVVNGKIVYQAGAVGP